MLLNGRMGRSTGWAVFIILAAAFLVSIQNQAVAAGPAKTQAKNFSFKTDEGLWVVPLPDKAWLKVLEEVTDEEMDMGTSVESWKKINIFLSRTDGKAVSGLIEINANHSVLEVDDRPPDDFCYEKQLRWSYHKQISAITRDTLCWGVRSVGFPIRTESEAWPKLIEKMERAGTPLPLDVTATQVRFFKSVSGKFLKIDYYFLRPKGKKPWHWREARKWAKGMLPRVVAGFEGK
jgi:hypothetical protein